MDVKSNEASAFYKRQQAWQEKHREVQKCQNCKFWLHGDPMRRIGNVGVCTYMGTHTEGFYDRNPNIPFWAQSMLQATISWHGGDCRTWKARDKTD